MINTNILVKDPESSAIEYRFSLQIPGDQAKPTTELLASIEPGSTENKSLLSLVRVIEFLLKLLEAK